MSGFWLTAYLGGKKRLYWVCCIGGGGQCLVGGIGWDEQQGVRAEGQQGNAIGRHCGGADPIGIGVGRRSVMHHRGGQEECDAPRGQMEKLKCNGCRSLGARKQLPNTLTMKA